jgi:hypothetical protein
MSWKAFCMFWQLSSGVAAVAGAAAELPLQGLPVKVLNVLEGFLEVLARWGHSYHLIYQLYLLLIFR